MMNLLVIKGRISSDIQLKATASGKEVANFSVAVNRRFKREETDFFEVVAWGKTGVFVNTYFKKGQEILLSGEMQCRKWPDKEGNNHYTWELIADTVEFCGSKNDGSVQPNQAEQPADDDDAPF